MESRLNSKLYDEDVALTVESLLSCFTGLDYLDRMNGDEVKLGDLFRSNKYVLVFGVMRPAHLMDSLDDELFPEDLVALCSELYYFRDDFEMVVAMTGFVSETSAPLYDYLLCEFHHSTLALPFHRCSISESVCDYLGVREWGDHSCILINADQNVLCRGSADAQKYLQELMPKPPLDVDTFSNRLKKSTWPVVSSVAKGPVILGATCPFVNFIKVLPEYSQDIISKVSGAQESRPIQIGHSFDIMSLLSGLSYLDRNNLGNKVAVQEETFVGKYIMLCCVHVPIFLDSVDARWMQELVNICFDLYATRNDFEMVVAVKMSSMADYEVVFDHFLSSLPSCLVIPYKESMHRDFICKYLDLVDSWYIQCLILDADVNRNVLFYGLPGSFLHYCGTDAFPFTKEKISEVIDKDKTSTLSLEGLLGCNSSYVLEDYNKKKITISELNKNVVAFYLCVDGSFASTLHDIHQQCIKAQLPFEIVMVYVPFITRLDPQVHKDKIDRLLKKKGISMSWWRLPFNLNVSQKFCRLMSSDRDDFKVMIVGPDNEYVDKYAGEILKECNVECYPFTREALLQKELKQLEELTLESLLVTGSTDYAYKGSTTFPLSHLQGKNVLVYYLSAEDDGPDYYHLVLKWYHEIKADVGDLEVVVVRLTNVVFENYDDLEIAETMEPLCVCPYDPEHSEILVKRIFFRYRAASETLLKFGSDGKICSFRAHNHLYDCGSNSSKTFRELGGLHLRREVIAVLKEAYSFMWDIN